MRQLAFTLAPVFVAMFVGSYFKMLTALAITSPRMNRELSAWTVMASLAHRASGITSVGLNAVAW
jgi:hypothetical protein